MSNTQLRRMVFGRPVRPYALAVTLATLVVTYAIITNQAVGRQLDGLPGHIIGAFGVLTVIALVCGWWARSDMWMTRGLLWSTGVWAGIGTILSIEGGAWVSGFLAWCWVVASGGAWLLEIDELRGREG